MKVNDNYFMSFIRRKKLIYKYSPEQLHFLGLMPRRISDIRARLDFGTCYLKEVSRS